MRASTPRPSAPASPRPAEPPPEPPPASGAAPPRRRRAAPATPPPAGRRWPKRILKTLVALLVAAAVAIGAVYGVRQIWFVGTNDADQVALFRGLPYDLPFGIELYSEQVSSDTELDALPEERRAVVTDHELRSEDDARSLLEDLEGAAATTPQQPGRNGGRGGNKPGGNGGKPGGNGNAKPGNGTGGSGGAQQGAGGNG